MTLTETATFTKKAFIVFGIITFLIIFAWSAWSYYKNYIYKPPPPPEPKPDLNFGILPKLKLSESSASATYVYNLSTETGSLPEDLPKLMKVYSIAPLSTDLLALERSKKLADSLDFTNGPAMLTTTRYQFSDENGGEFIVNLDTGNFKYSHNISSDSAHLLEDPDFEDENRLTENFKRFLAGKDLLKDQLKDGRVEVIYEKPSKSDSQFAIIYLWQQDIDKMPIVTSTFSQGLIKATANRFSDENTKFEKLDYIYWPIDVNNSATYPLITVDEAFKRLSDGKGSIIISPPTNIISIQKVYLAYYLSTEYQSFLQPVYVFEGKNFVAYIQAINEDQLEK